MIRFVKRQHPNVVSLGDVIVRDGEKERVVDLRPRDFFLVVPNGRRNEAFGTRVVFWRELADMSAA